MDTEIKPHPAAFSARSFLQGLGGEELIRWQVTFKALAEQGNKTAAHCHAALEKLLNKQTVMDTELLGLAWVIFRRDLKHPTEEPDKK